MKIARRAPWTWLIVAAALAVTGVVAGLAHRSAGTTARPDAATALVVAAKSPSVSSPDPPGASSSALPVPAAAAAVARWSDRRLAAQLCVCGVPAGQPLLGRRYARMGIGGIVLLGGGARDTLARDLAAVLRAAPHGVKPFIASDEEGGQVQRLRHVIYALPSARRMGAWSARRTRSAAARYGARMRRLHVSVVFGPVADLDVPGRYMSGLDRCFSPDPAVVASHVVAWVTGLRGARVLATVKHWPGHGHAADTHAGAARVPPAPALRRADMVPFERAFGARVPLVMVGHLRSRGLTGDQTPASLSRRALSYLRAQAGDATVIVTDSLSMAATTRALGIETPVAAVRALKAGADLALFASAKPGAVVAAVAAAIRSGRLPREQAETSALRVLRLKRLAGLAPSLPE